MWKVVYHPAAQKELAGLPERERSAILNAVEKLAALGDRLPFPHSSNVQGTVDLRELRPRAGRSPWRVFYRRIGEVIVIGAIGPEAEVDIHGFRRATASAARRLSEIEE